VPAEGGIGELEELPVRADDLAENRTPGMTRTLLACGDRKYARYGVSSYPVWPAFTSRLRPRA